MGIPKAMASITVLHPIAAVVSNHKIMFDYDLRFEAALPTDLNEGVLGLWFAQGTTLANKTPG
jgi:hypothetical protein